MFVRLAAMELQMCQGIGAEFDSLDLGDTRLDRRALKLLETLAANPSASINAASDGWSDTLAAYRFFDNAKVKPQSILGSHRQATEQRIAQEDVVLLVQDTTELDFSKHPPKDAGLLDQEFRFGLYDHSHVAFTPQGLCLGVVEVDFFDRTFESLGKGRERKCDPIETKETYRWLLGYRLACELARNHPETQVISVADSEADIYDIFLEVSKQQNAAEFVIRGKQDRRGLKIDPEKGGKNYVKVRDEVARSELKFIRELHLPQTPKRQPRRATLEVRAKTVSVKPPHQRDQLEAVTYNLVLVEEVGRSEDDDTKICWLLITTLPIDSKEAIERVIETYVGRWPIEPFFRTYKTGCRVEEVQLESNDRLIRCLLFYKIIAWQITYLTFLGRECPNLACDAIFADCEWKPVWKIVEGAKPPKRPPPLSDFLSVLAQLGGYNRRSHDRPPGPQVIWTGIRRMLDFAIAWQAFGPTGPGEP